MVYFYVHLAKYTAQRTDVHRSVGLDGTSSLSENYLRNSEK